MLRCARDIKVKKDIVAAIVSGAITSAFVSVGYIVVRGRVKVEAEKKTPVSAPVLEPLDTNGA